MSDSEATFRFGSGKLPCVSAAPPHLSAYPGWRFVAIRGGGFEHTPGWRALLRYVWMLLTCQRVDHG